MRFQHRDQPLDGSMVGDRPLYIALCKPSCEQLHGRFHRVVLTVHAGFEPRRSEEHTSELQSLMRSSYAVVCLIKKTQCRTHITQAHIINSIVAAPQNNRSKLNK